jgi:hypothetical protein
MTMITNSSSVPLERFIRITVGLPEENERFILAFKEVLEEVQA